MKKLISSLIAVILILSCVTVNASASEQEEDHMKNFNRYRSSPMTLYTAKLPQYIKGSFDYDPDYIDIVPHYPGYEDKGYIFPLASEEYGSLYEVSYTVEDTVVTFEYRLKEGATLDKYLDCVDRSLANSGSEPVSREPGTLHWFIIFDVALRWENVTLGQVQNPQLYEVVNTDGTVDYKNGNRLAEAYLHAGYLFPLESLEPILVQPTEPVDENNYQYRDQVLSQYSLTKDQLTEYDEIYEHKDQDGKVDWALVKAATEVKTSPLYTDPRYYEFGNRVMEVEYKGEPFTFNMGVYSVKDERFIQPGEAEMYELDDLEEIWTELGPGRLMGDMDGDNELSIADATLIGRCQAEINNYPTEDQNIPLDYAPNAIGYFSDFDQDGDRSIMDATAIQRFLAGLPYRPADWTPYPHGGQEPTEPTESQPTESQPTEPQPTEPQPTEPQPTEPQPDPSIPHITRCEAVKDGVQVTWTAVEGAEHYRLYYRNKSGGWTKCAETDGLTAVDTHAAPSNSYRYTVRCVSADGSRFMSDYDHNGVAFSLLYNPAISNLTTRLDGIEISASYAAEDTTASDFAYLRIYRKENDSWKRIAELGPDDEQPFRDTDVQPGKTYTYTARIVSEDGVFMSYFNTKGSTHSYTLSSCVPDLEFVIYTGDNMALVQPKENNKFGLTHFYLDTFTTDGEYLGSFNLTDEPVYIRSKDIVEGAEFLYILSGLNANDQVITSYEKDGIYVQMIKAPLDLKVTKTGNRKYRLDWDITYDGHGNYYYNLNIYKDDEEEPIIDPGIINYYNHYDIDLSDYPEDTKWTIVLYKSDRNRLSCSAPYLLEFSEKDFE